MSEWISIKDRLPDDGIVVAAKFKGNWPNHGFGGIRDVYRWNGEWFNIPDGVDIIEWIP